MLYLPLASVFCVVLKIFRLGVVTVSVTPSTGAPDESVTVPTSRHEAGSAHREAAARMPAAAAAQRIEFFIVIPPAAFVPSGRPFVRILWESGPGEKTAWEERRIPDSRRFRPGP